MFFHLSLTLDLKMITSFVVIFTIGKSPHSSEIFNVLIVG